MTTRRLVIGMPKSGTTMLYRALRGATDSLCMMEISNERQTAYLLAHDGRDVLAKVLTEYVDRIDLPLAPWDHIAFIVRDPRDVVVSWMLYRPFIRHAFSNEAYVAELVALLRRKEADPAAVSLRELLELGESHGVPQRWPSDYAALFAVEDRVLAARPDAHVVRFDRFTAGLTADVARAMRVELDDGPVGLGDYNRENHRRGDSDVWRSWFTEDDVEQWRPTFDPYLARHGFDQSWSLPDEPSIDPAVSSDHVERHTARLRSGDRPNGQLRDRHAYDADRLAMLADAARDGRESAMIELALAHREGWGVERDLGRCISILHDCVERGNANAMVQLGMAHDEGVGVPVDGDRARQLFDGARGVVGNRAAKRLMRRARPGWRERADHA